MLHTTIRCNWIILAASGLGMLGAVLAGCSAAGSKPAPAQAQAPAATQAVAAKGGAQLWAENCMRCHNLRPPTEYSSAEWQIVVHHMRLRAGLTGEEQRAITAFLQSASH